MTFSSDATIVFNLDDRTARNKEAVKSMINGITVCIQLVPARTAYRSVTRISAAGVLLYQAGGGRH